MAGLVNESRILTPFTPSLLHLCTVKIAIPLVNYFDIETLEAVFEEVQGANALASSEQSRDINVKIAKGKLLSIPPLLRKRVMDAVNGMLYTRRKWFFEHFHFLLMKNGFIIYHRYDGLIDTYKTLQPLILDGSIDTKWRFEIACNYCFEESIRTLWSQMEASGETNVFEAKYDLVRFWVRWLQEGSRVPWTQAALEYLEPCTFYTLKYSPLFPLLLPEERKKFLPYLPFAVGDDLRLYLYSMTREEAEPILKDVTPRVIRCFLDWPLQSFFLETVEKLHTFIDDVAFDYLLQGILFCKDTRKDFDYGTLFEDFWKSFEYILDKLQIKASNSGVESEK